MKQHPRSHPVPDRNTPMEYVQRCMAPPYMGENKGEMRRGRLTEWASRSWGRIQKLNRSGKQYELRI